MKEFMVSTLAHAHGKEKLMIIWKLSPGSNDPRENIQLLHPELYMLLIYTYKAILNI